MKKSKSAGGRGSGTERPISLDEARDKAIDLLSECFAQDRVTMEEFERRVTLAQEAGTIPELGKALEGLRGGVQGVGTVVAGATGASEAVRSDDLAAVARMGADLPAGRIRPTDRAVAVFSETKRSGPWIPARRNTLAAVMGSMVLDLREALLGPGETLFTVTAVMSSVELIVPPGLHIECSGSAILGSFEQRGTRSVLASGDMPLVRIDGFAVLSSVEIEYRHPGESKREARRRRRREKRERRRLRRAERRGLGPGR